MKVKVINTMKTNKLIAEFMELPLVPCNIGTEDGVVTEGYQHPKVNSPCTIDGLQYKYSWDWLMPVVEKVFVLSEDEEAWRMDIESGLTTLNIDETYRAVVEFIEYYNKNK